MVSLTAEPLLSSPPYIPGDVIYSVTDFETSGVSPLYGARIIEVGIVRTDGLGNIIDEFSTLVNPCGSVGMSSVHGIRSQDVAAAPEFGDIAGHIIDKLQGTVLVAHNARFEEQFLEAEFARLGMAFPRIPIFCTMQWARKADPIVPRRSLGFLMEYFDLEHDKNCAHQALGDCLATARLLKFYINKRKDKQRSFAAGLRIDLDRLCVEWPQAAGRERVVPRCKR